MLLWSQNALISGLALALLHSLWQGAIFGLAGFTLQARFEAGPRPTFAAASFSLLLFTFFALWLGTFCCFI